MDIKQLTAFVTVAELGTVTRASDSLRVTQSSVTRQIQALEQELGVTLFERTRNGMTLTTAGRVMADHSRSALLELGRARAELAPISDAAAEKVSVGLLESIADIVGVPVATTLLREHPQLELRVAVGDSGRLRRWMEDGELDMAITAESPCVPVKYPTPLAMEQLWVIAPPEAGLRADTPVALRDIVTHPMVVPPPGSALRDLVDGAVTGLGAGFRVAVSTGALRMQKLLVAAGRGWAILPPVAFTEELAAHEISAAPVSGPRLQRRIVLASAEPGRSTPSADVVARILVRLARNEIRDGRWSAARLTGYRGDDGRLSR